MTGPTTVAVRSGEGASDYRVHIGYGLRARVVELAREAAPRVRRWVVIADSNTGPLYGDAVGAAFASAGQGGEVLTLPAGEVNKVRSEWSRLTDEMLALGVGRDGGVIAVGGGVVTDLAGFVAATFMRGIPVLQMPTSLLAMVDASVGGKTGVDTPQGKNLVGAFHPPVAVVMDPEVLSTLPVAERAQGLVEAVKHGAIHDRAYGDMVCEASSSILAGELDAAAPVLQRSVEIKADVVSRDEYEGGVRETLNFGHTVGHALEHLSGLQLPHGTAVAQGMLWEARLGAALGVSDEGTEDVLRHWLAPLRLELASRTHSHAALSGALLMDKKVRSGRIRVVLLERPGTVSPEAGSWSREVPLDAVLAAAPGAQD